MSMNNLLALLGFQLVGEFLHRVAHLPLSGPLLGMALLFAMLLVTGGPSESLQSTARPLLAFLALLFVPAGAGVILHLDLIAAYWLPILVATAGGAAASLAAAAWTLRLAGRLADHATAVADPDHGAATERPLRDASAAPALDGDPR